VLFWVVFLGARALFTYGASQWFPQQLGTWLYDHDISTAVFSDAFIVFAIAPLLTRTAGLAVRSARVPRIPAPRAGTEPSTTDRPPEEATGRSARS